MDRFSYVNISDHPTNRNKKVFYFKNHLHANYFENLLIEEKLWYEKQIDEEGDQKIYFGVKKQDYKAAMKLNYLTMGQYRKPFIPDAFFRYLLISISLIILGLAVTGALLSN